MFASRNAKPAVILLLLAACASANDTDAQSHEQARLKNAEPVKVITLRFGKELWRFSPAADGVGVDVAVEAEGQPTTEMKLGVDPPIGEVVDFVATAKELSKEWRIIGVGVAATRTGSNEVSYWMFEHISGRWAGCGPLVSRPLNDPFDMMAIGLPGGDSLMLSLQDLTRPDTPPDTDRVESHLFVNHCPAGSVELNRKLTHHHHTTSTPLFNRIGALERSGDKKSGLDATVNP